MQSLLLFCLPFSQRKRFTQMRAASLKRVEQHAGLRSLSKTEGFCILFLRNKKIDHSKPRAKSVFQKTLLLLSSCYFVSQRFDCVDGSKKMAA